MKPETQYPKGGNAGATLARPPYFSLQSRGPSAAFPYRARTLRERESLKRARQAELDAWNGATRDLTVQSSAKQPLFRVNHQLNGQQKTIELAGLIGLILISLWAMDLGVFSSPKSIAYWDHFVTVLDGILH